MTVHGRTLEEAYTKFLDDHAREAERLQALREQRNVRTRQTYAELRRVLAECGPFLAGHGFVLVEHEPAAEITDSALMSPAASIADAASRQVVVTVAVDGDTFKVTQPLLVAAEPHTTNDLDDAIVRVGQTLAAHKCARTIDLPAMQ
jgi:predicted nucleic acid-binding Zn ribbon protein